MSGAAWIVLGVAAVLLFWVIGAYNRLVSMRNAIAEAWAQADEALRRRAEATERLVGALREPLAAEHGALDTLLAAQAQLAHCAGAMSARPLVPANAAAWVEAESRFAAAAVRVFALVDGHAGLREHDALAAVRSPWDEAGQRLPFVRRLFNESAAAYDEALRVFPTSLLSPMFGFAPAGRL